MAAHHASVSPSARLRAVAYAFAPSHAPSRRRMRLRLEQESLPTFDVHVRGCKQEENYGMYVSAQASPRPGVLALMDEAIGTPGLAVGICSASTRGGFEKVVDAVVGKERLDKLDVIIAGDDVSAVATMHSAPA
eukprot:6173652-Pleurochrysis_carterae.AAC.6